MSSSRIDLDAPSATSDTVRSGSRTAALSDGRCISVPLDWYPRLLHVTPEERDHRELHAGGGHIHWLDLDEGLSIEGLLAGRPSQESRKSLMRWLTARQDQRPVSPDALLAHDRDHHTE